MPTCDYKKNVNKCKSLIHADLSIGMMLFSSVVLLVSLLNDYTKSEELLGTHIIFRHGERSPSYPYEGSRGDAQFWSNGLGQLTVRGQLQQIALGQYFRERYSNLLNATYLASEITVRSSDYDRTLMSAYSNLVGLYPTSKPMEVSEKMLQSNLWPSALPWQPIPVHTVPKSIDHVIAVSSCDRYDQLVEEMRQSSRIVSLNTEFRDLIQYLEKHTNQSIADIFIAWDIADTLLIEALYNILPPWATPSIMKEIRRLEDLCFYHLLYSAEINRLRAGPVLNDILENVNHLIAKNDKRRKMKLYSGHDISISAVLAFLGVNYVHQPPFASAVFFDLYRQDDGSHHLKIEYLNVTNSRIAHTVRLPECSSAVMCPLEGFVRSYRSRMATEMEKECRALNIGKGKSLAEPKPRRSSSRLFFPPSI